MSFAGTDITARETVVRQGQVLTSRDTGVLAAIGLILAVGIGIELLVFAPLERRVLRSRGLITRVL